MGSGGIIGGPSVSRTGAWLRPTGDSCSCAFAVLRSRISTKVYGWKLKRSAHARPRAKLRYMVRSKRIGELADARSLPEQLSTVRVDKFFACRLAGRGIGIVRGVGCGCRAQIERTGAPPVQRPPCGPGNDGGCASNYAYGPDLGHREQSGE